MALVNVPMPVPSVVLVDRAMVGLAVVLQQTPRAVTAAPPSSVILPPLAAVVDVMEVTAVVVMDGKVAIMFGALISFWQLNAIWVGTFAIQRFKKRVNEPESRFRLIHSFSLLGAEGLN